MSQQLPPPLSDADLPEYILQGCKKPEPLVVRGALMFILYLVIYLVLTTILSSLISTVDSERLRKMVVFVLIGYLLYILYTPLWTKLRDDWRVRCERYRDFKAQVGTFEAMGMERKFAIREAESDMKQKEELRRVRTRRI